MSSGMLRQHFWLLPSHQFLSALFPKYFAGTVMCLRRFTDQDFLTNFKNTFNPFPVITDDGCAAGGCFKQAYAGE